MPRGRAARAGCAGEPGGRRARPPLCEPASTRGLSRRSRHSPAGWCHCDVRARGVRAGRAGVRASRRPFGKEENREACCSVRTWGLRLGGRRETHAAVGRRVLGASSCEPVRDAPVRQRYRKTRLPRRWGKRKQRKLEKNPKNKGNRTNGQNKQITKATTSNFSPPPPPPFLIRCNRIQYQASELDLKRADLLFSIGEMNAKSVSKNYL